MLLCGPGEFKFVVGTGPSFDESASSSSPEPVTIEIEHNGVLIDRVYLGSGSTHSWWNSNPLIRNPQPKDSVTIRIDGPACIRLDWPCLEPK